MLDFFKQLSLKRSAWIFLAFTAFALESDRTLLSIRHEFATLCTLCL